MGRVVMGYYLPQWTPYNVISYLYQNLLSRGVNVEQTSPMSIRVKRGALLLWEGYAEVRAYQAGQYIELEISSSETRSFVTGGLIGRSRAKAARKDLINAIVSILGQPAYTREI